MAENEPSNTPTFFLSESAVEIRLRNQDSLRIFWRSHSPLMIVRARPTRADPVYEIQLAWDLGDRLETFSWLWIDAISGRVMKQFPD